MVNSQLLYDEMARTFSLKPGLEPAEFLGPQKHAMLRLMELGLSKHQAQAATTQAIMNGGIEVSLAQVEKFTAGYRRTDQ